VNELWGRFLAAWDNLSPRERILGSVAVGSVAVMILVLAVVRPILSSGDSARSRVAAAEQQLALMLRLRRDYDEINGRLGTIERRIQTDQDQRNILTLLASLATSAAVKIDSMEERQAQSDERYRETRVEVVLKNVTLTQTVNYLHSIETAERIFSVKGMRIKTRRDKPELLDVNFTVSSFEPL
jgi:Tfp pilus assembly protein PilO